MGKYEKGVEVAKKAIQLDPDSPVGYLQLASHQQYEGHLKEAEDALRRAAERKLEMPELLFQRYDLAFLNNDTAEMERTVALAKGKPDAEDLLALREGFVLAYSGHLQQARKKSQRAAELSRQSGQPGRTALVFSPAALWEGFFGNASAARQGARAALALSKDRDVEYGAAFALALPPSLKHSRVIWKSASRKIAPSGSLTRRPFARFSR